MKVAEIAGVLDAEFRVGETSDPEMIRHALSDDCQKLVVPEYRERGTGLLFSFGAEAEVVYCVTFLTDETIDAVVDEASGPGLIFTHHPFNYYEDGRGLGPVSDEQVARLRDRGLSVYAIHGPLDVGLNVSVSRSLASRLALADQRPFRAASGGHLGVYGRTECGSVEELACVVGRVLGLGRVDRFDNGGDVNLVGVVAGGGDRISIAKEAMKLGCRTYVTGTAVHRWELMSKGNEEFRKFAAKVGLNLIGATHYNTEKCGVEDVVGFLNDRGYKAKFIEDPVLSVYEAGNFGVAGSDSASV